MKHLAPLLLSIGITYAGMKSDQPNGLLATINIDYENKLNSFKHMLRLKNVFNHYLLFKDGFKNRDNVHEIRYAKKNSRVKSTKTEFYYPSSALEEMEKKNGKIMAVDYYTYEDNLVTRLRSKQDFSDQGSYDIEFHFEWNKDSGKAKSKNFDVDFDFQKLKIERLKWVGKNHSKEIEKVDSGFIVKTYRDSKLYSLDKFVTNNYEITEIQSDFNKDGKFDLFYDVKNKIFIEK